METNLSAQELNLKETAFFLKELTKHRELPDWVILKAEMLLNNRQFKKFTPEFIFEKAVIHFSVEYPEFFFKSYRYRVVMEVKNIVRYAMFIFGIHIEDIAQFFKMHRTSTYRMIIATKNLASVDLDFKKKINDFLIFCEND